MTTVPSWYFAPDGTRDTIVTALLGGAKQLRLTLNPGEEYANTYRFSTEGFAEAAKPVLAQCSGTPGTSLAPAATPQATPTPRPTIQPTARPEPLLSYREVIDLVHPSIVRLATGGSLGSGFIIRTLENSAYVATNRTRGRRRRENRFCGQSVIRQSTLASLSERTTGTTSR